MPDTVITAHDFARDAVRREPNDRGRGYCDGAIYDLPIGVETRWASAENPTGAKGQGGHAGAGRKGAASIPVKAGSSVVLAEARGSSGTVRRISITFLDPSVMVTGSPCCSAKMLRSLRIDMYWDGAATPAVSAPLGDFFGFGLGQRVAFDSALFSSPSGRGLNSFVPMPFRSGMRIVVTNEPKGTSYAVSSDTIVALSAGQRPREAPAAPRRTRLRVHHCSLLRARLLPPRTAWDVKSLGLTSVGGRFWPRCQRPGRRAQIRDPELPDPMTLSSLSSTGAVIRNRDWPVRRYSFAEDS